MDNDITNTNSIFKKRNWNLNQNWWFQRQIGKFMHASLIVFFIIITFCPPLATPKFWCWCHHWPEAAQWIYHALLEKFSIWEMKHLKTWVLFSIWKRKLLPDKQGKIGITLCIKYVPAEWHERSLHPRSSWDHMRAPNQFSFAKSNENPWNPSKYVDTVTDCAYLDHLGSKTSDDFLTTFKLGLRVPIPR